MKVVNQSPFHAIAQVADLLTPELAAVVIVKSTLDFDDDGRLSISQQQMPLVPDPLETPFGELHGELFFKKRGVDLCVLGTITRAQPVRYTSLRLRVGDRFTHELFAIGDRRWQDTGAGLAQSEPLPFEQMPLGYTHAYGGRVEFNGQAATNPDNPIGRGYYTSAEQARNGLLPNIESATGQRVRHWQDAAPVVGWGPYPSYWQLRAARQVEIDAEQYAVRRVDPGVFNHAHPDLVFDELPAGTPIVIEGMREAAIRLWVPRSPAEIEVHVGAEIRMIPAPIDGLFIWTDVRKLVITQRARFDYVFAPKEIRQAIVRVAA